MSIVKKPSENSPLKRARRRRCERKQMPQNRVRATKGKSWEKTVEDARLPTEQEKVAFFDSLGIDHWQLPKRLYHGANGNQTRYFALKLPIACDAQNRPPSPMSIRAKIPIQSCAPGVIRMTGFGELCD